MTGLQRPDAEKDMASEYALLVADTVMVPQEGELAPGKEKERVLTFSCPKQWTDVAYFFKVGPMAHLCTSLWAFTEKQNQSWTLAPLTLSTYIA